MDEEETIVKSFLTAGEVSLTACLVLVVVKIKKRQRRSTQLYRAPKYD